MGQALGLLHRRLDLVEAEVVGDLVDEVDDVVEVADEPQDVLAVDRRDERRVQPLVDVVGDPVALLLADHDVPREVGPVGVVGEHLVQQVGAADDVGGRLLEQVEEHAVLAGEHLGQAGHARRRVACESDVKATVSRARRRRVAWVLGASSGRPCVGETMRARLLSVLAVAVARARARRAGRPAAPGLDLDAGDDHRARRDQAPRRRPAARATCRPAPRRRSSSRWARTSTTPGRRGRSARSRARRTTRPGAAGPSSRFYDFVNGAHLMERGYTYVMVDLRGFGGSTGCLDWGGPGEQADVKAAVEWAASQPWSTGHVGMYGKSYDGVTGLMGVALKPAGLDAVVSQEPVYDMYRYLYSNRVRFQNSLLTPALYTAIDATPGSIQDDPGYNVNGADNTARPGCYAANYLDQQSDDHGSAFWKSRDLIAKAQGSTVPLFMTQGFIENNTKPDGAYDFFNGVAGPKRAWFGMWDHVRGNDVDAERAPGHGPPRLVRRGHALLRPAPARRRAVRAGPAGRRGDQRRDVAQRGPVAARRRARRSRRRCSPARTPTTRRTTAPPTAARPTARGSGPSRRRWPTTRTSRACRR